MTITHGDDPIDRFQRRSKSERRKGTGKKCQCGEDRPLALLLGSTPTVCASCDRLSKRRSPVDDHHPAGRANHPTTVPIWANDHRAVLSDAQYDWPNETWRNPSGTPTLAVAAWFRGYLETSEYLASNFLLHGVRFLEKLEPFLRKRLGANWWRGTELEEFAPKRKQEREVPNAK
jgi:hypothetical protein